MSSKSRKRSRKPATTNQVNNNVVASTCELSWLQIDWKAAIAAAKEHNQQKPISYLVRGVVIKRLRKYKQHKITPEDIQTTLQLLSQSTDTTHHSLFKVIANCLKFKT